MLCIGDPLTPDDARWAVAEAKRFLADIERGFSAL